MLTLAFDTCYGACSAAIGQYEPGGRVEVLAAEFEARATGHAEALMPMIERVGRGAADVTPRGFRLAKLDRIAVTVGPGTFTGVRTGVAAARGLALALALPVVTVTSLEVIGARARRSMGGDAEGVPLVVAMQAGRGWLHVAMFAPEGAAYGATIALEEADAEAALPSGAIAIVGTGAAKMVEAARRRGIEVRAWRDDVQPSAEEVLSLTCNANGVQMSVKPLYLRPPDAKPQAGPMLRRAGHDATGTA